jgi:hypothetical protein
VIRVICVPAVLEGLSARAARRALPFFSFVSMKLRSLSVELVSFLFRSFRDTGDFLFLFTTIA